MRASLLSLACLCLAGCLTQESLGKDINDGGDAASDTDGTGDGDGDGDGTSGEESGSGSADGTDGTDGTDSTDGGMDGACAPSGQDTTCMSCQKDVCCDFWAACHESDHCICIITCLGEGHGMDACTTHCGTDDGQAHDLNTCTANHCTDVGCP